MVVKDHINLTMLREANWNQSQLNGKWDNSDNFSLIINLFFCILVLCGYFANIALYSFFYLPACTGNGIRRETLGNDIPPLTPSHSHSWKFELFWYKMLSRAEIVSNLLVVWLLSVISSLSFSSSSRSKVERNSLKWQCT